jgi:hypothetical protein
VTILLVPIALFAMSRFLTSSLMMSPEEIVFAPPGCVAHAAPPPSARNSATHPIALRRM